jgi:hypothetical protein
VLYMRCPGFIGLTATALMLGVVLHAATAPEEQIRSEIVTAIQRSIDALSRGDLDTAEAMDTNDWVSVTLNQKPVPKEEQAAINRKYLDEIKPPPGWKAVWKPDYARTGTMTGIQIYDLKLDGDTAIVLYLVGNTHPEMIDGAAHQVWNGSHARDTWIRTSAGWKRRRHEKLTVNERMVDGKPLAPAGK